MQWSEITSSPPTRVLRQFAGVWLLVFGLLAVQQGALHERPVAALVLGALAALVGLPGLVRPPLSRPVYTAAMVLAFPVGWVVTKAVMLVTYYGVFTPLALVFRLTGRDALALRFRPAAETYWSPKPAANDPSRYFRPF